MHLPESPDNEESAAPRTPFEGQYKALILEQLRRIQGGTAISSLINREPVPAGQEAGIGRDMDTLFVDGTSHLLVAAEHAKAHGIDIEGALRVVDTEKPNRAPCILVLPTPFLMGENPTPIAQDNAIVLAALVEQNRYQLAA